MRPAHFDSQITDLIGTLVDLQDAYRAASHDARSPDARHKHREDALVERVGWHTDPTGNTAVELDETLRLVRDDLSALKAVVRRMRGRLSTWLPATAPTGPRDICQADGCHRPGYARHAGHGPRLCRPHYMRHWRAHAS